MVKINLRTAIRMKNSAGEIRSIKGPGFSWNRPPRLSDFYGVGPGQIAIHLHSDNAVRDGNGNIQTFINSGGAGAMFNANRIGSVIPLTDKALDFTSAPKGYFETGNVADLNGARLMYVFSLRNYTVTTRWLGSDGVEFRSSTNTQGWTIQMWSSLSGTGSSFVNLFTTRQPNEDKFVLVETEYLGNGKISTWINGVRLGNSTNYPATHPFPGPIPLKYIGKGNGNGQGFLGLLGDVLAVQIGGNYDAAVLAARRHLNKRYQLGIVT